MRKFFKDVFRTTGVFVISILFTLGLVALAANIKWPSQTPAGETSGGKFQSYFNNLKGNCPTGQAVVGINSDFTKKCGVIYTYAWNSSDWGGCTKTCGGGTQTRIVVCKRSDNKTVNDTYCTGTKPITSKTCNTQVCSIESLGVSKAFPETRWVGPYDITLADFGYTGEKIHKSKITKLNLQTFLRSVRTNDDVYKHSLNLNLDSNQKYQALDTRVSPKVFTIQDNFSNYKQSNCPTFLRNLYQEHGKGYSNHSDSLSSIAIYDTNGYLKGIRVASCSPDTSGDAGYGGSHLFFLELDTDEGKVIIGQ